jgi:SnoaL-like domain
VTDAATAVANLVGRYAECIDAGDYAGAGHLLAHAGVGGEEGALLRGEEAVTGLFTATARRYEDGTPRTKHVTTNLIIDAEDGATEATARSYFTVLQATAGFPLQPILAGRYRDRFEFVAGAWRFSERRFTIELVGDVSHHMLANLPDEGS